MLRRSILYGGYLLFLWLSVTTLRAEDGYRLWLRYEPLPAAVATGYQARITSANPG